MYRRLKSCTLYIKLLSYSLLLNSSNVYLRRYQFLITHLRRDAARPARAFSFRRKQCPSQLKLTMLLSPRCQMKILRLIRQTAGSQGMSFPIWHLRLVEVVSHVPHEQLRATNWGASRPLSILSSRVSVKINMLLWQLYTMNVKISNGVFCSIIIIQLDGIRAG